MKKTMILLLASLLPFAGAANEADLNRALRRAVIHGDRVEVAKQLQAGASLTATNSGGLTPLLLAAYWDRSDTALDLLKAGADPQCKSKSGMSALAYAARNGDERLAAALLARGAATEDPFGNDRSIVANAVIGGNPQVLKLLLDRHATLPASIDRSGRTPLLAAATRGHEEIVDMLLAAHANPNTPDQFGYTPLLAAVEHRHEKIAQRLIKAGAAVNAFGHCGDQCALGHTPLGNAAQNNDVQLTKLLLAAGADPRARGQFAMLAADFHGSVEVFLLLKQAGAACPPPKVAHPAMRLIDAGKVTVPTVDPPANRDLGLTSQAGEPSAPAPVPRRSNAEIRIAIFTEDQTMSAALTAAVSQLPGFAVLERAQMERILAEHQLTAATAAGAANVAGLGKLLGADCIVSIAPFHTGKQLTSTRIVSVGTGVMLDSLIDQIPLDNVMTWAGTVARRLASLAAKLDLKPHTAAALSIVSLHSTVGTASGLAVERDLELLLTHRLAHEPQLFVLERADMNRLIQEKIANGSEESFWTGAYLVDGMIDISLAQSNNMTLRLHLQPATGSTNRPQDLMIQGDRTQLVALTEQAVAAIRQVLVKQTTDQTLTWNPQDEARRYGQEARWAEACQIHEVAAATADSAWALGLQTAEVARLRVLARAGCIEQQAQRVRQSIHGSLNNDVTLSCDYHDPLNHPCRGAECPSPADFISSGIRLMEAVDEMLQLGVPEDSLAIRKAFAAGETVLIFISSAQDKIDNADALAVMKRLFRLVGLAAIKHLTDDGPLFECAASAVFRSCETDAELADGLNILLQHHFATQDEYKRARLREVIALPTRHQEEDHKSRWERWHSALQQIGRKLCGTMVHEDQATGLFLRYQTSASARERREIARQFIQRFQDLRPLVAKDTRAFRPYLGIFGQLGDGGDEWWEICPFFGRSEARENGRVILKSTEPKYEFLRDFFVYLCAHSSDLDDGVFNEITRHPGFPPEDLAMMNAALDGHVARVGTLTHANPDYLAFIKRHRFDGPAPATVPGSEAAPRPARMAPTGEPVAGAKPGTLVVSRQWNPGEATMDVPGVLKIQDRSFVWAEDRLWYYGEKEGGDGTRTGFVYATNLQTFRTETLQLPCYRADYNSAVLAVTPESVYACRAGAFLAVCKRATRQWKLYPDVKPLAGAVPATVGNRVYVVFETKDGNSGVVEYEDGHTTTLVSTRRNPPESPADRPDCHILKVSADQGQILVTTSQTNHQLNAAWVYTLETKSWSEARTNDWNRFHKPSYPNEGHDNWFIVPEKRTNRMQPIRMANGNARISLEFQSPGRTLTGAFCSLIVATPYGLVFAGHSHELWFAPFEDVKKALGQ